MLLVKERADHPNDDRPSFVHARRRAPRDRVAGSYAVRSSLADKSSGVTTTRPELPPRARPTRRASRRRLDYASSVGKRARRALANRAATASVAFGGTSSESGREALAADPRISRWNWTRDEHRIEATPPRARSTADPEVPHARRVGRAAPPARRGQNATCEDSASPSCPRKRDEEDRRLRPERRRHRRGDPVREQLREDPTGSLLLRAYCQS